MRYFRVTRGDDERLVVSDGDDSYDLTSAPDGPSTVVELLAADETRQGLDEAAEAYLDDAEEIEFDDDDLVLPVEPPEVWASGVTYQISEEARQEESDKPDVYIDVYESERPEVFFKATPSRTVGPNESVGIRGDSDWDTPEPELAIVLYQGEIVGFTIGNDMSSRSIEGENPLYLPQAKVYDRCAALGPSVTSAGEVDDPHDLEMTMQIHRDGEVVYEGQTNTGEMVRTCEELSSYLTRHNVVPDLTVLMTGTALVPEGDFTLHEDDLVEIEIEDIGTLTNPVTTV
ncbi:fumarylacetoacetate hydrolase family protein [Halosimplex carlsbadense 2-9-1]|uniref:Fumarylacetoacetate hydrolase family protein n=1 Tax=Halosimplex carlsbadense 2-9-1 TaxID=797114 RepID=M0CQK0_9EURY|nr:fumarylacetoacetate hydrolase family protein [Halosimplex carlsbadense]ELZ24164.1 fumarylacetoacetate hydrolase family protein [Halosimplex carlsbadense 2-9-1]